MDALRKKIRYMSFRKQFGKMFVEFDPVILLLEVHLKKNLREGRSQMPITVFLKI